MKVFVICDNQNLGYNAYYQTTQTICQFIVQMQSTEHHQNHDSLSTEAKWKLAGQLVQKIRKLWSNTQSPPQQSIDEIVIHSTNDPVEREQFLSNSDDYSFVVMEPQYKGPPYALDKYLMGDKAFKYNFPVIVILDDEDMEGLARRNDWQKRMFPTSVHFLTLKEMQRPDTVAWLCGRMAFFDRVKANLRNREPLPPSATLPTDEPSPILRDNVIWLCPSPGGKTPGAV